VPAADRAELEKGVKELEDRIAPLRRADAKAELPNVEIYHKAVDWALRHNEIFDAKQISTAKDLLKQGLARVEALEKGETPWNKQTGLVVRGYRSKIDGSVQPYGLVITPSSTAPADPSAPWPLHFWCHGRGEKLSELAFLAEHQKSPGEFVPPGAILCHLYGRFCNANKFAGEVDLFEALEDIKKHYKIDEQRLVVRGFSMGGAACWQFATHHSGMWAAAAPGAGFAETAEFFKVFAPGKEAPPEWEQKLWRWYDCTTMAANLANTTTIAYSGEIDGQKQAADIMVKYAEKEGITFPHIIGPQTPHKYHPESKPKINELVDAAVAKGNDPRPEEVRLVTYSLIYPQVAWVRIEGMEKQWERAEVNAKWVGPKIEVKTSNVTELNLAPLMTKANPGGPQAVIVDGTEIPSRGATPQVRLRKAGGKWEPLRPTVVTGLPADLKKSLDESVPKKKTPKICGPIDHAFMSSFVFVRPTGKPLNDAVGAWAKSEFDHAVDAWRRVFRGDVRIVDDTKLSQAEITASNLVLWGDPSSNAAIKRVLAQLPLKWDATALELHGQKIDAANHAPIMIYPNPLNPAKYVVLNSGFTFRETAALNNSDQTPKLPDWAIVDVRTPPGPKWPGKIVDAGFFDEYWR
jgi:pimeloyl-ACP methyl ester carboxylesterase